MRRTVVPVSFALAGALLGHVVLAQGGLRPLAEYAAEAKAKGKATIEVTASSGELKVITPPDQWLSVSSVILANPMRLSGMETVLPYTVLTWNVFTIVQTLKKDPGPEPSGCSRFEQPSQLTLEPNEIAVPLEGGTALIDGVTIKIVRRDSATRFKLDQQYLLIGRSCKPRILLLAAPESGAYRVIPDRTLENPESDDFLLASFIRWLGSVDAVKQYLKKFK
jgi:hypothetical protein